MTFLKHLIKETVWEYLSEQQTSDTIIWYHGSNKPVKKFLFSLIGKNNERITNYHGYGIYFISDEKRAKSYGNVITKITIKTNTDILKGKITPKQLLKIYNGLIKENIKLRDNDQIFYTNPSYGEYSVLNDPEDFYEFLGRVYANNLKTPESISTFLLRCGIDGMEVTNDVSDYILVVFNENIINIQPVNH